VSNALSPVHHQNTDVHPSDKLEWQTWGGGGLGDPLTRPAETVAIEVRRRLVTIAGAEKNYGVVINPTTLQVDEVATETLRADVERAEAGKEAPLYDRGGSMAQLVEACKEETGFEPPRPQWEEECYGPHVAIPYVKEWYAKAGELGYGMWDV
jgi:5-oxoprolinase (ATP-hydrolysing)